MESHTHSVAHLFAQLGLPADEAAIGQFIAHHAPLPGAVPLAEASFWSPSQAEFLAGEIASDADWAEVVDQLDAMLRH
ncbi:MAG: DUF2789 domain-containing protein [Leptothrix sp. (in: b-proteobacteria)]